MNSDKHTAALFRADSEIFHEPASNEMNTNKLIVKFNLGRLISSPLQCGLETQQMTRRLMIHLTQKHMLSILNSLSGYPLTLHKLQIV